MTTYRTTGDWGAGVGRRLTSAEIDTNFYEINQRLDAIEADLAAGYANPISQITSTGTSLHIHMTSGQIYGPIKLPVIQWTDAGNWSAGTTYYINDIIAVPGDGIYHVLKDHVADNNFDPDATSGGDPIYSRLISIPTPAAVIDVYDPIVILTEAHANSYVRCHNVAGTTIYIEAGTFNPPTEIKMRQVDVGPVLLAYGDSGTFINVPEGCDLGSAKVGATIWIKAVGDNEWDAGGDLSTAS